MSNLLPSTKTAKHGNGNGSEYLIEMRSVVKTFKTAAGPFTALKRREPARQSRRVRRHHRQVGQRQIDAAQHADRHRSTDGG